MGEFRNKATSRKHMQSSKAVSILLILFYLQLELAQCIVSSLITASVVLLLLQLLSLVSFYFGKPQIYQECYTILLSSKKIPSTNLKHIFDYYVCVVCNYILLCSHRKQYVTSLLTFYEICKPSCYSTSYHHMNAI